MKKLNVLNYAACWLIIIFTTTSIGIYGQSNRLTNERGQLVWQYNQSISINKDKPDTVLVTFVFLNGVYQTAITFRQEFFYSQIEWIETSDIQVGREERVEFITANLAPAQPIVLRYRLINKVINNEVTLEKSAILIMNEDFEVRKEIIPEQKFLKEVK